MTRLFDLLCLFADILVILFWLRVSTSLVTEREALESSGEKDL